jgi:ABC-type Na+ transport system ATPase subunit NatA
MHNQTGSHHYFPKFLTPFVKKCSTRSVGRCFSRKKMATDHFNSLQENKIFKVTSARIPFSEVPTRKFPAIYFTRLGQHPVVIKEKTPMGFSIQLWDGRESLCDRGRLEKTLEPCGFFIPESRPDKFKSAKKLVAALWNEKRLIAMGIGNGLVTASLLVLFIPLLHHILQSCLPLAEITSAGVAIGGMAGALLASLGYFQARWVISSYFNGIYNTQIATQLRMPPPHPIQILSRVSANRALVEAATAPFFLVAAVLFLESDFVSVASWGAAISCVVPAFVFLASLPNLLEQWHQALWFYQEKSRGPASAPKVAITHDVNVVVRSHNLYLAHPDESRPPLIDQVSLKISRGEKVGFIGKSRGDVSIFLRVISGLLNSDRGVVWVDGRIVDGDQTSLIGWFSERTSLIKGTLRENICHAAEPVILTREIEKITAVTGLNRVKGYREMGLEATVSESGQELSKEDKIRLQLTRSLINWPDLLVFDAPQDPIQHAIFREILDKYLAAAPHSTLLLGASHLAQLEITNRTMVLESGKIVRDGSTQHIISTMANQKA